MVRRRLGPERSSPAQSALADRLASELKSDRESGQPLVYEYELRPGRLRVIVVWDEWERMPLDERTWVILRAYELAEGTPARNAIALASGLTVPEASAAGMLPYQVGTALRKGDPVAFEQCARAMQAEGASKLFGPDVLQLRFATQEEAERCRQRLIERLPKSDDVWVINRDVVAQGYAGGYENGEIGNP